MSDDGREIVADFVFRVYRNWSAISVQPLVSTSDSVSGGDIEIFVGLIGQLLGLSTA